MREAARHAASLCKAVRPRGYVIFVAGERWACERLGQPCELWKHSFRQHAFAITMCCCTVEISTRPGSQELLFAGACSKHTIRRAGENDIAAEGPACPPPPKWSRPDRQRLRSKPASRCTQACAPATHVIAASLRAGRRRPRAVRPLQASRGSRVRKYACAGVGLHWHQALSYDETPVLCGAAAAKQARGGGSAE